MAHGKEHFTRLDALRDGEETTPAICSRTIYTKGPYTAAEFSLPFYASRILIHRISEAQDKKK